MNPIIDDHDHLTCLRCNSYPRRKDNCTSTLRKRRRRRGRSDSEHVYLCRLLPSL